MIQAFADANHLLFYRLYFPIICRQSIIVIIAVMNNRLSVFFAVVCMLSAVHCGTRKSAAIPAPAPEKASLLSIAQGIDTAATQSMLDEGKSILQTQCAKCHAYKDPKKFTAEKWNSYLTAMIPKAKLTEAQARALRVYSLAFQKQ